MDQKKVVLLGAGGKMGCRVTPNIKDCPEYEITYVEISDAGVERLKAFGVTASKTYEAVPLADIVIFALPDVLIGKVSKEIVPMMKSGAMVIGLDPAAAFAGVLPEREDIRYFVVHPCHPPLLKFEDNLSLDAQKDWFGGVGAAKMALVCAIFKGNDSDYEEGEAFAKKMFKPIFASYRVTVEQMALLEPGLVESISAPLVQGIKMAMDACVAKGVPEDAAMAFLMGHLNVQFGVIFGFAGFPFSDGANLALKNAMDVIYKPDWLDQIMNIEAVKHSVAEITDSIKK